MRSLGLSVDILPAHARDFTGYGVIAAPGLMHMDDALKGALVAADAQVILGPRSSARTAEMAIPVPLQVAATSIFIANTCKAMPRLLKPRSQAILSSWRPGI